MGAWNILSVATGDSTSAASVALPKPANGARIKISSIHASYSAAAIKSFTITDGSTSRGTYHVHNQRDVYFDEPVEINDSATISLAASGASGVVPALNVAYFKL